MYEQYTTCPLNKQASEKQAEKLAQQVEQFLHPLVVCLDLVLDRRCGWPFCGTGVALTIHRAPTTGFWPARIVWGLLRPVPPPPVAHGFGARITSPTRHS